MLLSHVYSALNDPGEPQGRSARQPAAGVPDEAQLPPQEGSFPAQPGDHPHRGGVLERLFACAVQVAPSHPPGDFIFWMPKRP